LIFGSDRARQFVDVQTPQHSTADPDMQPSMHKSSAAVATQRDFSLPLCDTFDVAWGKRAGVAGR